MAPKQPAIIIYVTAATDRDRRRDGRATTNMVTEMAATNTTRTPLLGTERGQLGTGAGADVRIRGGEVPCRFGRTCASSPFRQSRQAQSEREYICKALRLHIFDS